MRLRWLAIVVGISMCAALWGAVTTFDARRFHDAYETAKREMAAGRYGIARQQLTDLEARWPGRSEVAYQLGVCEYSRGKAEGAMAAWERVPIASTFGLKAAVGRAMILSGAGRFSPAEEILESALRESKQGSDELRSALNLLLRQEGRSADVRRLIINSWPYASDPAYVLRQLFLLDNSAYPLEAVQAMLKKGDPQDDRVWLGRANLATRLGHFEEASGLLDACLKRRPDDPAIWRSLLDLALASENVELAWKALAKLPAGELTSVELLDLRIWLSSQAKNQEEEKKALSALLEEEPGHTKTLERLATLAWNASQHDEATRLNRRKAEVNEIKDRYRSLTSRDDRLKYAGELAKLANQLGRRLEAKGWTDLARSGANVAGQIRQPLNEEASANLSGRSLADLLADLRPKDLLTTTAVPSRPTPEFSDDAEAVGLRFVHDNGHTAKRPPPPETMSGGVGIIDYDGDGWYDVYAVQGGPFPPGEASERDGDRLFRNRGDGTFEDVTITSKIGSFAHGYGHGVTVGDYDNDGHPDLFITRWRSYALYRNRGDGTFEDVTTAAGFGGNRDWPTSAAFGDLDFDGDLDLYVCHYLVYDPANPRRCSHPEKPEYHECSPRDFDPIPDHVFRNDAGRFVDVTAEAGIVDPHGRGLGVVIADLDDDNKVDIFVANDMSANFLFHNLGGFKFEETALLAGAAGSANGDYQSGMGVACGDIDGDGRPDIAVTNFYGESTTLFQNIGGGNFSDRTAALGLAVPSRYLLGFGIAFPDVDNDGHLDLMSVNGHIHDGRPQYPWMMPVQLLVGSDGGRLTDVTRQAGPPFQPLRLGRGLAVGDLDNDGRLDGLVLAQNEPLSYFHNQSKVGHFVTFLLEGRTSNRDGVGALVVVESGGRRQVNQRIGGGSYQSANDPRLHFGLGDLTKIESVEVRWPSGKVDRYQDLAADTGYHLQEGRSQAQPLNGWKSR